MLAVCADMTGYRLDNGVIIEQLTDNIFKVTQGQGESAEPTQAIAYKGAPVEPAVKSDGEVDLLETPTTIVLVDRSTGKIAFFDREGNLLLEEKTSISNSEPVKRVEFYTPDSVAFYGAGERGHSLNLRGDTLSFYNRQNYGYTEGDPRTSQMGISVPWIVNDNGTGVLFDDYNKAQIIIGDKEIIYTSDTPKPLTYYFVNGGSLAGAMKDFTTLTGRQGLPPLWSLGYITSKYGYHDRNEALGVVDTLKSGGYPLDGLVLDLYWYGVETDMGRLAWDPEKWPDPAGMLDTLKSKGVNTVLITQPYINKIGAIENYDVLDAFGMLTKDAAGKTHDVTTWVGEAGMFDVANPETREWIWRRLQPLTQQGVAGWWGDLGEPEVHPATIVHANGETAEQFHNVYGNVWSKLIYDGLRENFPEMRPLLMMRGGTTGLQRYNVMPWTTDVSRSWGGLQPQIKLMLSSGLSGLGYMSSDIGGFAVDPENPTDPELYVRWLEMGAFTPTLRTHAQEKPEPYNYPEYEEISKKYIRMRYEWLPYNYTLAYENAAYGLPLARPLNFHGDNPGEKYSKIEDEYLWGDNVLVAPVMKQGATSREVTFPSGNWYDFFNPLHTYKGGSTAEVQAPLDVLPLFVRAGSFIPLYQQPVENVNDYNPQLLTVRYYPSLEASSYTMYDDNRLSPTALEDGQYALTHFAARTENKDLVIEMSTEGSYEGMPQFKQMTLEIPGINRPRKVYFSGIGELPEMQSEKMIRQYGWTYDTRNKTITVIFPWNLERESLTLEF